MIKVRKDEPHYAFLHEGEDLESNQWGKAIDTVPDEHPLRKQALQINDYKAPGDNPNRYKQHGFHFTADNCIGCHACEAACSEKNNLPAHISFRSVGYIEGGSYPAYRRMNISMACNHCDNPVCLKGCPTRAYTKYAEYGAVIQDPDICFGCGYCTWVCPYNAPQLDPIEGQVSKCNMCIDRLEVGLKPACAAACLGGALDFGVTEAKPENRDQAKVQIPGFPTPDITHPNIRFQQVKSLPREMQRPDTMPIRYSRDEQGQGDYKPKGYVKSANKLWSWRKLSSRENPLVIFTLITQAVVGAFALLFFAPSLGLDLAKQDYPVMLPAFLCVLLGLQTLGLVLSTAHLGKPHRFYRAFNNLRYSPVSREVAAVALFFNLAGLYTLSLLLPTWFAALPGNLGATIQILTGWGASIMGVLCIYAMHKIYRIKARPFWDHWQVLSSFYASVFSLGALALVLVYIATATNIKSQTLILLGSLISMGLMLEIVGLAFHRRYLLKRGGEAEASYLEQNSTYGKTYYFRNALLLASLALSAGLTVFAVEWWTAWFMLAVGVLSASVIGRALFYVLVIPTTMPGAFFWRNQGFQQHARETGLADMPQVGVVPHGH